MECLELEQLCTFTVDSLLFGIDVNDVQEVIRYQEMTRVPHSAMEVRGLINLRGQIVAAIDMRRRLEFPEAEASALQVNVVVKSSEGPVSLLVDAVEDVVEVNSTVLEHCPPTIDRRTRELISGVLKLPEELLLVLDTEKTVAVGRA